ncbi:hypothetical protein, partial [Herbiconiux daphne]
PLQKFIQQVQDGTMTLRQFAAIVAQDKAAAKMLSGVAQKRFDRAINSDRQMSSFIQSVINNGGRFSLRGRKGGARTNELVRMLNFVNAEQSTAKGALAVLRRATDRLGIKANTTKELRKAANITYRMVNKMEEYLRSVYDAASSFTSGQLQEVVANYVNAEMADLQAIEDNMEQIIEMLTDAMNLEKKPVNFPGGQRIKLEDIE